MRPPRIAVACPAKVNLALHVLHRRPDRYHELDTVFQAIDLWDRLELEAQEELDLVCEGRPVPDGRDNLVFRAAELLRAAAGERPGRGARIKLRKEIPPGGGLGGGSSDAAGALLGCATLWELDLDHTDLAALARDLGADVPFFLSGGTARGRGRGDVIEPLPALPETPLLLGLPPFGVSTAEVFQDAATKLTLPRIGVNLPVLFGHKWPEKNDFRFAANDLERIVFERWPELLRFRDALLEGGAVAALLSGSGSTVYGVFESSPEAERGAASLGKDFPDWELASVRTTAGGVRLIPAP